MTKRNVEQFLKMLTNLDGILVKAMAHADAKKFDVNNFMNERLSPDMLNFTKQVQITCDTAKFAVAYLSHQTAPAFEDNEKTFPELRERVQKTTDYLKTALEFNFADYKTAKVSPKWAKGKWLTGEEYFHELALPNFYFHLSMTYAILRAAGVELGKDNYIGALNFKE